jgi:LL-diaminopimelate aminotransferase
MIRANENYAKLQASYLFIEIGRKVAAYTDARPEVEVIKLGIGDVTRPLVPAVIRGFHQGVDEMADADSFRGYGPEQGYSFLREIIVENDFAPRGCPIDADDIFISDGAKTDTANFQELFAVDISVAVPDPVYPVYVDTNVMAGRTGLSSGGRYDGLTYLEGTPANGFVPEPEELDADLVYLCFPNNPTGATASKEQLTRWVNWARQRGSLILFDAAYEAFVRDPALPRSIYEIPGAETCAVEFRSFSKTAGFTGTRCAVTVVPGALEIAGAGGKAVKLRDLWNRRQGTKMNGVSYPVQMAAAAVYTPEGKEQTRGESDYYLENAAIIRKAMEQAGYDIWGGENSPYVWVKTGEDSWTTFDRLLEGAGVVVTPGAGFGRMGEGFIRISAFNDRRNVEKAVERIAASL